jgi:glycine dehydrogenase subunit 1
MYTPHTDDDIAEMLSAIGVASLDDLVHVSEALVPKEAIAIEAGLPEYELAGAMTALAGQNSATGFHSFLGAGSYRHYIPPVLGALAMRGEFLTAYTPYQAEVSQGYLQAIYEWQTYIALLTGLDYANASVYDGATALAEAAIMAVNANGHRKIVISSAVHPQSRAVLQTYAAGIGLEIIELPYAADGRTSFKNLETLLAADDIAAVVVQSPNFFGVVDEPDAESVARLRAHDTVLIASIAEAMSLGVLRSPAEWGADIAVGEAQSFGIAQAYGGPYAGFMACSEKHLRRLPGRLVGRTVDGSGKPAFTLTLQAREQHIRRERATSNICTNQAHCALLATIYLAAMGESGLRDCATANLRMVRQLSDTLAQVPGCSRPFDAPVFNEYVLRVPGTAAQALHFLESRKILGGVDLGRWYPELSDCILLTATEITDDDAIGALYDGLHRYVVSLAQGAS